MKIHTTEEFDMFMSQLVDTNATLDFYTDFEKCKRYVENISIKLNQLNYLIGKDDLNGAVSALWSENPNVFSVLDILIAVRTRDKKKVLDDAGVPRLIESYFCTLDGVLEYINNTGLKDLFCNKQVTNLVDYVFGIEVGLDTNARKNRSGTLMENKIAQIFDNAGIVYRREVYSYDFENVNKILGEDVKRFDFAISASNKTYLIEVNFYSGGGSKLNEVARSYTDLSPKINSCSDVEFVWITDGIGWKNARNKLEEAFYAIPHIYNLTTVVDFVKRINKSAID